MILIVASVLAGIVIGYAIGEWLIERVREASAKPGFEFPERPTRPDTDTTSCEAAIATVKAYEDILRRVRNKLSSLEQVLTNLAIQIGALTAAAAAAWITAALVASTPLVGVALAGAFVAAATAATRLLLDTIALRVELSRERDRLTSQIPQAEAELEEAIAIRDRVCDPSRIEVSPS
ncbi:MAG: hypothetical protein AAGC79_08245 [Pseudomonadota bacterium]